MEPLLGRPLSLENNIFNRIGSVFTAYDAGDVHKNQEHHQGRKLDSTPCRRLSHDFSMEYPTCCLVCKFTPTSASFVYAIVRGYPMILIWSTRYAVWSANSLLPVPLLCTPEVVDDRLLWKGEIKVTARAVKDEIQLLLWDILVRESINNEFEQTFLSQGRCRLPVIL
ncbi:hypothetical protein J6590_078364, partial [Homalodisca vitripennis]